MVLLEVVLDAVALHGADPELDGLREEQDPLAATSAGITHGAPTRQRFSAIESQPVLGEEAYLIRIT